MSSFQALYEYFPPNKELVTQQDTVVVIMDDMIKKRVNMDHVLKS
jgi:hypothetical protein